MSKKQILIFVTIAAVVISGGLYLTKPLWQNTSKNRWNSAVRENLNGKVKVIGVKKYEAVDNFGQTIKGPLSDWNVRNEFDENGNETVCKVFDSVGNLTYYYVYQHNERNQESECLSYKNGLFNGKTLFLYDSDGYQIERLEYDSNWQLERGFQMKYDKNGLCTNSTGYDSNGGTWTAQNVYNENGQIIESKTNMSSGQNYSMQKEYDIHGNIIKQSGSYGLVETYDYKYDQQNNWIERVQYYNGKAKYIEDRTIEYW
jgi:hypothetical protein